MAILRRPSYTLFEVVLVMAILVGLIALAYPSLEAMYGDYRVTAAVDGVRAAWALGRAQALNEGRPYRFAIVYDQRDYRLAPDAPNFWSGDSVGDLAPEDPSNPPVIVENKLPAGVRFSASDNIAPLDPLPQIDPKGDLTQSMDTGVPRDWSTVVTFLPDGTASRDVELIFQARGARPIALKLRGFTSVVSVRQLQ